MLKPNQEPIMENKQINQVTRKNISLESLKVTPPRTANEISQRIRKGIFAETKPRKTGLDRE
jgi:hypothetical protein